MVQLCNTFLLVSRGIYYIVYLLVLYATMLLLYTYLCTYLYTLKLKKTRLNSELNPNPHVFEDVFYESEFEDVFYISVFEDVFYISVFEDHV